MTNPTNSKYPAYMEANLSILEMEDGEERD